MICPTCAEENLSDDRFCEACGSDLADGAAAPTITPDAEITDPMAAVAAARAGQRLAVRRDDNAERFDDPTGSVRVTAPVDTRPVCGSCHEGRYAHGWCNTCGASEPNPRDHVEDDRGHLAAVSDLGRRHHRNEDSFAISTDATVAVVCDGVSSTVNPDVASAAAAHAALAHLLVDPGDLIGAHRAAADAVNAVDAPAHADLGFPSCTFLAGVAVANRVAVAGLGDCRAFWIPDDPAVAAEVLTLDDSWAHQAVEAGMDQAVADADPRAHVITRWLGRDADPAWEPRITTRTLDGPGIVLLCSDGLWNYASTPEQIRAVLPAGLPIDQARTLVQFAVDAGGHDNITAAVLRMPLLSTDTETESA